MDAKSIFDTLLSQEHWVDLLMQKYTQKADARQVNMGLTYTVAETHDLAKEITNDIKRWIAKIG